MSKYLFIPIVISKRKIIQFIVIQLMLIIATSCTPPAQEYSVDDQYSLARNRIENMKSQLDFSIKLDKDTVKFDESIMFTAHFSNKTDNPIMLRIPQQSDILDILVPKIALIYSITPIDESISLKTPLSFLGSPYVLGDPLLSNEFEILDPNSSKHVSLELPNMVYLEQGNEWVESKLPPGQYWVNLTYENLYIGYEINKPDQIYYTDLSAWVGKIEATPVLLTILQ